MTHSCTYVWHRNCIWRLFELLPQKISSASSSNLIFHVKRELFSFCFLKISEDVTSALSEEIEFKVLSFYISAWVKISKEKRSLNCVARGCVWRQPLMRVFPQKLLLNYTFIFSSSNNLISEKFCKVPILISALLTLDT